jgi:hypothetical protein
VGGLDGAGCDPVRAEGGTGRVRRSRVGLLAVALLVTAVVALAAPALAGAATTLTVDAAAGPPSYNPTGVTIPAGEYVTVTATGMWTVGSGNPSLTSDANGVPGKFNGGYLDGTAQAGTLIGSLDGGSTWFAIGAGPTNVSGPGTLILADNDYSTNFGDNAGTLSVTISDPIPPQNVTFVGAYTGEGASINTAGTTNPNYEPILTVQDPAVEWFNPATQAWQPAYDVGYHPWGEVGGTDSWIACGPTLYSCTGTSPSNTYTAQYRLRFTVPADWSNPTMTLTIMADNEASVSLNGQTIVSDFVGGPGGETATVTPPLQTGVNELDFSVTDWGGIAGFNYRADMQVEAPSPPAAIVGCAPGTYSATGTTPCVDAPAGTYVAGSWATSATPCPAGSYSANSGAAACDPAPVDTYVDTQGATAPTPCPYGTTTNGQTGQTACVPIPPTITLQSISPGPNGNGWNSGPVTVTWACTYSQSATVTVVLSTDGGNQSATGTCVGVVDSSLTASDTQSGISIDQTAPTLAPAVSPNPVALDGAATASPNASDGLSGIDSAKTSCGSVDTSAYGTFTVSCTATDEAGNTATATASYQVTVQATKQAVLAEIKAAESSGSRDQQAALRIAAAALQRSLNPHLWTDGNHPSSRGVFTDEKQAADALAALSHERRNTLPAGTVQGWIDSIVGDDRALAAIAIDDATSAGDTAKELGQASRELAAGDSAADHGRAADAIEHYANAWQQVSAKSLLSFRHQGDRDYRGDSHR